jgi:hypothetical protein
MALNCEQHLNHAMQGLLSFNKLLASLPSRYADCLHPDLQKPLKDPISKPLVQSQKAEQQF